LLRNKEEETQVESATYDAAVFSCNQMLTIDDMCGNIILEKYMSNALIQFRVENKLKKDATKVYENLGLDLSSAIKIFLKKSIKLQRLPFSINPEDDLLDEQIRMNKELAIKELDSMKLNISSDVDIKDDIYNAIVGKYESIN
jgi:DNA-damage-inducible protein J